MHQLEPGEPSGLAQWRANQEEMQRIREKLDAACKCILDLREAVLELDGTMRGLRASKPVVATGTGKTLEEALRPAFEALGD